MSELRCAVIGVGYLGRFHAQKYATLANVNLVGVFDTFADNAEKVAAELNVKVFSNLQVLVQEVDAVSIAASTTAHYDIAKFCLEQGLHVLIEKPITEHLKEAQDLVDIANKNKLILQVGHLERFNAAYQAFIPHLTSPLLIEMQRLATFKKRGSEVDVILDLMIHDLDILLSWIKSPIIDVKANGLSIMTKAVDLANVSIRFENQCVAHLTASRVHATLERLTRVYQDKDYYVLNYQEQQLTRFIADPNAENNLYLVQEHIACEKKDALKEQITAFVDSITHQKPIEVDGLAGLNALELALHIQSLIHLPQEVKSFV